MQRPGRLQYSPVLVCLHNNRKCVAMRNFSQHDRTSPFIETMSLWTSLLRPLRPGNSCKGFTGSSQYRPLHCHHHRHYRHHRHHRHHHHHYHHYHHHHRHHTWLQYISMYISRHDRLVCNLCASHPFWWQCLRFVGYVWTCTYFTYVHHYCACPERGQCVGALLLNDEICPLLHT